MPVGNLPEGTLLPFCSVTSCCVPPFSAPSCCVPPCSVPSHPYSVCPVPPPPFSPVCCLVPPGFAPQIACCVRFAPGGRFPLPAKRQARLHGNVLCGCGVSGLCRLGKTLPANIGRGGGLVRGTFSGYGCRLPATLRSNATRARTLRIGRLPPGWCVVAIAKERGSGNRFRCLSLLHDWVPAGGIRIRKPAKFRASWCRCC